MLNHITLMGRLTRDPELRYTQTNTPVSSFTIAVDRDYPSRDSGERQTDFIDIVAWRSTAEFVHKYFVKGALVAVSGRLQIRDWNDKEGNKRRSAEVVAENVYFAESKRSREGGDYERGAAPQQSGGYPQQSGGYSQQQPGGYSQQSGGYSQQQPGGYSQQSGGYDSGYDSIGPSRSAFSEIDDDDGELPF